MLCLIQLNDIACIVIMTLECTQYKREVSMCVGTSLMCISRARSWLLRVIPEEPGDYFSMIAPFATAIFSLSKTEHTG